MLKLKNKLTLTIPEMGFSSEITFESMTDTEREMMDKTVKYSKAHPGRGVSVVLEENVLVDEFSGIGFNVKSDPPTYVQVNRDVTIRDIIEWNRVNSIKSVFDESQLSHILMDFVVILSGSVVVAKALMIMQDGNHKLWINPKSDEVSQHVKILSGHVLNNIEIPLQFLTYCIPSKK